MFTHLHVHSEYSLLDGACRIRPMLEKVSRMGQTSLAITDHGVMYGAVEFYKEAKKCGIKPIIGCECYVASGSRLQKNQSDGKVRYHLILLCKNETGYRNLIKLVSESFITGFYVKPRIDFELLKKYHEGLIALSGCLFGEISQNLLNGNYSQAKKVALDYEDLFGKGNYYIEIQNHFLDEQKKINPLLMKLSAETGIPLVATNDAHYVDKEDSTVQKVLICIGTNHTLGESTGIDFSTDEFYLKSEEEMRLAFDFCPEAVDNTGIIAEKCDFNFEFGNTKLPHFDIPGGIDHNEYFRSLCFKGLKNRYGISPPEEYVDRMNYELNVIGSMGYTDYYLIVHDFINAAKKKGIPVGPGRGSGAASICAYAIGITGIDPMKYNLLFERFLNPERVSMPDFDIDFCFERREEVIDYVIQKYGSDHVAQIVTFGTLAAKAAVRDVGRVLGIPYAAVDTVAKLIPNELNITLRSALEKSVELNNRYQSDKQCHELIDLAMRVEGIPRHASTHAAGVVITERPVSEYVPLARNDDNIVTQFTMTTLEELGLLKMDFLGLRTLTVIKNAEKFVKKQNPLFSIDNIPLDDRKVYNMFASGRTDGVFQFESAGMKQVLTRIKPVNMEDLTAIIALYRPGPMDSIPKYIKNRKHKDSIKYKIPLLKPILDVTNGCIVYQEQVMQICRDVAGYSYGRSDIVRRAMAKKKHDVMINERRNFVYGLTDENGNVVCEGAARRGVGEKEANELFDEMLSFASYAFNKAHAAAYSFVSYQTAYLKCHYPCEFFASLLTAFFDSTDKIVHYISECSNLGIKITPPDINLSGAEFTVSKNNIVFSLAAVKGVGKNLVNAICREREEGGKFSGFYDFCRRMNGGEINRRAAESLIKCGAFDGFGVTRRQMIMSVDSIFDSLQGERQRNISGQIGFDDLGGSAVSSGSSNSYNYPEFDEFPPHILQQFEKEVSGLYLTGHPLDKYASVYKNLNCLTINQAKQSSALSAGNNQRILGLITSLRKKSDKSGKTMAFLQLEDRTDKVEVIVFGTVYEKNPQCFTENKVVVIDGRCDAADDGTTKIIANAVSLCPDPSSVPQNKAEEKKLTVKSGGRVKGLFLRFDSDKSPQVECCSKILRIFDGNTPSYFYFSDTGNYIKNPAGCPVMLNDVMLREIVSILGSENVILNE
ncbi:MAG: DNA polymerase III subunit alpha [Clostridiales bacterium]|nr:DNA polymerase III subunit alpha [Clostridiales bacterium]